MSDFKAKMHQIRFQLGLRPRPLWGSLQRSPKPPLRGLLLKGGEEKGERGEGRGKEKEKGGREKGEGRGKRPPCSDFTI